MRFLFALFIVVPLLEIYVLIRMGKILGGLPTIALVVATALLGAVLLKRQGQETLRKVQLKMAQGTLPAGELADGLFLALGGVLLLVPGFITDLVGFACLVPMIRRRMLSGLIKLWGSGQRGQVVARSTGAQGSQTGGHTIEGEYKKED